MVNPSIVGRLTGRTLFPFQIGFRLLNRRETISSKRNNFFYFYDFVNFFFGVLGSCINNITLKNKVAEMFKIVFGLKQGSGSEIREEINSLKHCVCLGGRHTNFLNVVEE